MNGIELFNAITKIDDDLIDRYTAEKKSECRSAGVNSQKGKTRINKKIILVAAVLLLAAAAVAGAAYASGVFYNPRKTIEETFHYPTGKGEIIRYTDGYVMPYKEIDVNAKPIVRDFSALMLTDSLSSKYLCSNLFQNEEYFKSLLLIRGHVETLCSDSFFTESIHLDEESKPDGNSYSYVGGCSWVDITVLDILILNGKTGEALEPYLSLIGKQIRVSSGLFWTYQSDGEQTKTNYGVNSFAPKPGTDAIIMINVNPTMKRDGEIQEYRVENGEDLFDLLQIKPKKRDEILSRKGTLNELDFNEIQGTIAENRNKIRDVFPAQNAAGQTITNFDQFLNMLQELDELCRAEYQKNKDDENYKNYQYGYFGLEDPRQQRFVMGDAILSLYD